eukprot:335704-Amphidinium_carterae.1
MRVQPTPRRGGRRGGVQGGASELVHEGMPEELRMPAVLQEVGDRAARVKSAAQMQMEPSAHEVRDSQREMENERCLAGMRAARAVMGEEQLKRVMSRVRLQLLKAIQVHPSLGRLTDVLGTQSLVPHPAREAVAHARHL